MSPILVELDPIGPDGRPSETTVWCPLCETIYRVPFERRYSWLCACPIRRWSEREMAKPLDLSRMGFGPESASPPPPGQLCEWQRIGPNGRITTAELEQAKRESRDGRRRR